MTASVLPKAAFCLATSLLVSIAVAQTFTGGITGVVTDPGGSVIPGAQVRLTNLDTNENRQGATNDVGEYTFTALAPGRYRIVLEHPGFKRFVEEPIEVRVQQFVGLNPKLEIGQDSQSVEVTGQAVLLDAVTSSLSQVVVNRQANELPLNGRNTLALVVYSWHPRARAISPEYGDAQFRGLGQFFFQRRRVRCERGFGGRSSRHHVSR